MTQVNAVIVKVSGVCNASFQEGDAFLVTGLNILPQNHNRACSLFYASMTLNAGRLGLEDGPLYISCPDPGTGDGGNVIVKLSAVES
jgi:uncharacterized repeat protein (TIGR04076 family)